MSSYSNKKKALIQALNQAEPVLIEDVFSAYVRTGTGSAVDVVTGKDAVSKNVLLWTKNRDQADSHVLSSTLRGVGQILSTNTTAAETSDADTVTAFNDDGYSLGSDVKVNTLNEAYVDWEFVEAPRFFQIREISHTNGAATTIELSDLATVGLVTIKRTDSTSDWYAWHKDLTSGYNLRLNTTAAESNTNAYISVSGTTVTFASGAPTGNYELCAWAHDPLGPSGDGSDGLIACGSYTGNGSAAGPEIDLGWEPQWLLTKAADQGVNWLCFDEMRGFADDRVLYPNLSNAESSFAGFEVTSKGFKVASADANINNSGSEYIYIAIRRGPMGLPTSGSQVCVVADRGAGDPAFVSNFPVDLAIYKDVVSVTDNALVARLLGTKQVPTSSTGAAGSSSRALFDYMDGWFEQLSALSTQYSWMLRRWPMCTDVVVYEGDGTAGHEVAHNLQVPPEMMWIKGLNFADIWPVYSAELGAGKILQVQSDTTPNTSVSWFNNTDPNSEVFTLGTNTSLNGNGNDYIALLFATLPGISKVGSFSHTNGADTDVDCGFTSGASAIIFKRVDSAGDWYLVDSERGYGKYSLLNSTAAEVTATTLNTLAIGFQVDSTFTTGNYIFWAVA